MKHVLKRQIVDLLDRHRIMTIATNRADGWPQATVVGYANDGLIIYCFIGRDSQKYANMSRDPRIVRPSRGMYGLAAWGLEDMPMKARRTTKTRRKAITSKTTKN